MFFYPESFKISTPVDTEIVIERDFHAPRELVFDALTKPELVRRWLLGPDGWTMPVCEIDLRVDGRYRYVWRKESTGMQMGMSGVFQEIARPQRLVATEKFDDAWYPGEALDITELERVAEITKLRMTIRYESKEARDIAAKSGMESGVATGYTRLEQLLESLSVSA
jgi:uncharacterized protein YndB with AHSA1/START domain